MTSQLPERPNLEQLKTQAKDLLHSVRAHDPAAVVRFRALPAFAGKSPADFVAVPPALHDAQSVIAREHGFVSWNALRERVEELTMAFDDAVNDFLRSATDGRSGRAERLLTAHPGIAMANLYTALVLGDAERVETYLAKNPALATQRGGPRDWEPLLYVCHTCMHRAMAARAKGLVAIARRLLAFGASPHATFTWPEHEGLSLPVLWGAATVTRLPAIAEILLAAGANPDDGESVYHAAENGDTAMLELLRAHRASPDGGKGAEAWGNTPLYFILGHTADSSRADDVRAGAQWLLEHGADPNRPCTRKAETPMHAAARDWDVPMLELLLRHGAHIRARRADGRTPFALAALHGNMAALEWLRDHDGGDEMTGAERFLAACARGDRAKADAMLRGEPALRAMVTHAGAIKLFMKMARRGSVGALETMLACGFDPRAADESGANALHYAALSGQLAAVQLLIAHGTPIEQRDNTYHASPWGWADFGSVNLRHPRGDYVGTVLALLEAGASVKADESDLSEDTLAALEQFRARAGSPPGVPQNS